MSRTFSRLLRQYDYRLPSARIALRPARPRDRAALVVDHGSRRPVVRFSKIGQYLPARAVLVLNQTKVIPARLVLRRPTGGLVRVVWTNSGPGWIEVLADRAIRSGEVLRLSGRLGLTVIGRRGSRVRLRPSFRLARFPIILRRHGMTPIPPYLRRTPLDEGRIRREYQSVFAIRPGSVAAPTASLHLTAGLIQRLRRQGFGLERLTLHVNLGTFAPLTPEAVRRGRLHPEAYDLSARTATRLTAAKRSGRPIIAVGTTVARALESAADRTGRLRSGSGLTRLFIRPGYRWRFVDGLVTNFHVPRSSLMMLVAAMTGRRRLLAIYRQALRRRLRFLSFGDAMLVGRR